MGSRVGWLEQPVLGRKRERVSRGGDGAVHGG